MKYADYYYYKNEYCGGLIPEESFDSCSARASEYINMHTFDRITEGYMQANPAAALKIRSCCCELAENIYKYSGLASKGENGSVKDNAAAISSEKIGQYSVTYQSESEEQAKKLSLAIGSDGNLDKLYYGIILKHLGNTGLMFRGVD